MHTTTTVHVTPATRAYGDILTTASGERFMRLHVGKSRYGGSAVDFIITDPEFLDFLANEAERLCREFVGDVPAPSQAYLDEIGERQSAEAVR